MLSIAKLLMPSIAKFSFQILLLIMYIFLPSFWVDFMLLFLLFFLFSYNWNYMNFDTVNKTVFKTAITMCY